MDLNISSTGGVSAQLLGQAPSQSLLSWRVIFDFNGGIFVLDDQDGVPGGTLAFINTNATWTAGQYRNFRVDLDSGANSIKYYYDNNLIYSASAGIFAGTSVEQVIMFGDNFYTPGQTVDFDNLVITPAPASAALLAFGLLAAGRRRR